MRHVLRKGHSSVYLQYDYIGDSMGIENLVATARDGTVVISFDVRPVDSNQRMDEEHLHTDELREIQLSDEYSIDNLASFLESPSAGGKEIIVELTTRGRMLRYRVAIGPAGLAFLPLVVQRLD
ncbi:hypothetical protein [Pinirhizobacter soli]|uniref:hypothetical protein n=1 Tax=Pinirhizobacter soli TaxID=2786953 RepID=UPI00202AA260|nr:hypothetical protein [Pinirhizobacter soli]